MKGTETVNQRAQRVCGMFLDWWVDTPSFQQQILLIGTGLDQVRQALSRQGHQCHSWSWFPEYTQQLIECPNIENLNGAVIRMPPEKDRLKLAMEMVAARLPEGTPLWVFGSNDEGVKSIAKLGPPYFTKGETVETRRHARIVQFLRKTEGQPRKTLSNYKLSTRLEYQGGKVDWISFPGTFAKGKLDVGSRLLLDSIRNLKKRKRLLDYGCGTGILCGLSDLAEEIHALDRDLLALKATKINVPQASIHWSDQWLADSTVSFDIIVSNPPIHNGKVEDHSIVKLLLSKARTHLTTDGELWMVVQHRVPVGQLLRSMPLTGEINQQDRVYKVWRIYRAETGASS